MRKYFFQTKVTSFDHQLYVYGFQKLGDRSSGRCAYFHELFLRNRLDLCKHIARRTKKSYANENSSTIPLVSYVPEFDNLALLEPAQDGSDIVTSTFTTIDGINLSQTGLMCKPRQTRYALVADSHANDKYNELCQISQARCDFFPYQQTCNTF